MGGSNGGMMHLNCTQECCGRDAMVVIVRMFYVIAIVKMVVL